MQHLLMHYTQLFIKSIALIHMGSTLFKETLTQMD